MSTWATGKWGGYSSKIRSTARIWPGRWRASGLNINQTEFQYPTATSLQAESPLPHGYDLPGLLSALSEKMEQRYLQLRAGHRDALKTDYLRILYRYQQEHGYESDGRPFRGIITGVDATGRLAIAEDGQVRYFDFKEVSFLIP